MPETDKSFTADEARAIGQELGIDWATSPFDVEQLRIGMKVELEHGLHDPQQSLVAFSSTNRQRLAGTRRVHQVGHARARAGRARARPTRP